MTGYAKLKEALLQHGAEYLGAIEEFVVGIGKSVRAEKWVLNGFGLIVCADNRTEQVGVHAFVGINGASVEQDIAFVEKAAASPNPVCGLIEPRAKTNEALLPRLRAIELELFEYSYGKTDEGLRFAGREEIAAAGASLNRAIEEVERRVKS